jgi:hypothetical protein
MVGVAGEEEDSEEERFVDMDKEERVEDVGGGEEGKGKSAYDPLKREPKWSQASSLPMYELLQLT